MNSTTKGPFGNYVTSLMIPKTNDCPLVLKKYYCVTGILLPSAITP